MGHIIPMVELAQRLTVQHNLSTALIVLVSQHNFNKEKTHLEALPDGMDHILLPPPNFDGLEANFAQIQAVTVDRSLPSIRHVIKSLMAIKHLVALVVDLFGVPAFDVACEFHIFPYIFFPSNAMTLSFFLYLPELDANVSCDQYKDLSEAVRIPGCRVPLRTEDILVPLHDRQNNIYQWLLHQVKKYRMAKGIMVNSFNEMEAGPIKALQESGFQNPLVYPVGPLVRTHSIGAGNTTTAKFEDSSAATRCTDDILKWLDDQPMGSILFMCFGSLGSLSLSQLHELAFGIEMSEIGFVWVIRSPNDSKSENTQLPSAFLPEGFAERTKVRGLVVSNWAPQAQILSHRSTGGFLTHCGWNSILESVVNDVPMIAWPLFAEQKMNAALLSEDLKIALRPRPSDKDGLVGRFCIADAVKNLMEGEEGKQLRQRASDLKDVAAKVMSKDGSSTKSLADLPCKWTNRIQT